MADEPESDINKDKLLGSGSSEPDTNIKDKKRELAKFKSKEEDAEVSYPEFLPSAESYEAIGQNLNVNLEDLKRRLKEDFSDEITNLEFNVSQLQAALLKQKLELEALEAENERLREERALLIAKLEEQENKPSPKELSREESISDEIDQEQYNEAKKTREESYEGGRNKLGIGGRPGRGLSNATIINQNVYQGDRIKLEDDSFLDWDKEASQYKLASANSGLKFTFWAVEAAYLEEGFINPNYPQFYSQTLLQKQVWYERTPHNRLDDTIGTQFGGRVPQQVLRDMLNQRVNTARVNPNGELTEHVDFEIAYKNWRYTYQVGTYFTNEAGDLYTILDVDERKSKGNAPAYRTDSKFTSPTYGQQKPTSAAEKAAWSSTLKGSAGKKKDLFKRRKPGQPPE